MTIRIKKRKLSGTEIEKIVSQMNKFPHVGYIDQKGWKQFNETGRLFVATRNNEFAGVCVSFKLKNWIKIGPLIVLEEFQKIGVGKALFQYATRHFAGKNLYVGSSHPRIHQLAIESQFTEIRSYWKLPNEIKIYLIRYFLGRLSLRFFSDAVRKKLFMRYRSYGYFLKYHS